jgi:cobalt-zinc-cadmium efflux system outer membrane protein
MTNGNRPRAGARMAWLALWLAAAPALAQTPPDSVDLAAVLALARDASPRLALERQNVAAARADRGTASAWPNPTVSYNHSRQPGDQTNFGSGRAQEMSIELPLLIAGQRGVRMKAADRGVEAAQARLAASGNDLAADAGAAFVALLLAQEKRAARVAGVDELARLRDVVAGRQSAGMESQYELLRVDVEQEAWRAQTAEAEADLADAQAQLATLLGFPDWRPHGTGELRSLQVKPEAVEDDAQGNPSYIAARRDEEAAQASVEVARRERFPAMSLTAGRFWTSHPFGATNSVGLTLEIPIFDTRGGALDKAHAEAASAGLRRQLVEAEVRANVQRYSTQVAQRAAALDRFDAQIAPRLPALEQMAEDAYRLGKSSITDLLDATRARYEAHMDQLDLVARLMEAQLRLRAARGELSVPS